MRVGVSATPCCARRVGLLPILVIGNARGGDDLGTPGTRI